MAVTCRAEWNVAVILWLSNDHVHVRHCHLIWVWSNATIRVLSGKIFIHPEKKKFHILHEINYLGSPLPPLSFFVGRLYQERLSPTKWLTRWHKVPQDEFRRWKQYTGFQRDWPNFEASHLLCSMSLLSTGVVEGVVRKRAATLIVVKGEVRWKLVTTIEDQCQILEPCHSDPTSTLSRCASVWLKHKFQGVNTLQ